MNESCYSSTGALIASGSADMSIRIWQNTSEGRSNVMKGHIAAVNSVCFSSDDQYLLSGSDDKTLRLWSVSDNLCTLSLQGHLDSINSCKFSPDGRMAGSASSDHSVKIWDLCHHQSIISWSDSSSPVTKLKFHPDGSSLSFASESGQILQKDLRSQRLLNNLQGHTSSVNSISYHPTGFYLVSGSSDSSLKIWDLRQNRTVYTLVGHENPIHAVSFASNGKYFVSAGDDSRIMLWDCLGIENNLDEKNEKFQSRSRSKTPVSRASDKSVKDIGLKVGTNKENRGKGKSKDFGGKLNAKDEICRIEGFGNVEPKGVRVENEVRKRMANERPVRTRNNLSVDFACDRSLSRLGRRSRMSEVPEEVSENIEKLVGQMDTVTRTLVVLEKRFCKFEDHVNMLYQTVKNPKKQI